MNRGLRSVTAATAVCVGAWTAVAGGAFGPAAVVGPSVFAGCLLTAVPLVLGWLLAVRAPMSPVGPALACLAAFMAATPAVEVWGRTAASVAPWWGSSVTAVIGAGAWPWQLAGFLWLLLVFPDGLLPGRRWAAVAVAVPTSVLLVHLTFVLTMNHHDLPPARSPISLPESIWEPALLLALGLLLVVVAGCLASVVARYRRGDERTRQQLGWLILAAGSVTVLMVGSWVVTATGLMGPVAHSGFLVGIVVLVPAAVTVAVLRYDLFEIDRLLGNSLAWVLTTVIAASLLAAAVVVVGSLIGPDSTVGLAGAVFGVAVVILPVHRYVHRAVGRLLDRERTVILERIHDFVERVRDGTAAPESVEDLLRSTVGDPGLTLLLADVDGGGYVGLSGSPVTPTPQGVRLPLRTQDKEIGVVVVTGGSTRRVRRAVVAATAARLPIEVSRLQMGLRRALDEVDDSRRRLVSAAIDERTRLERDLHDGVQQQLVAVGMQLRATQRRLAPDHPASHELDRAVDRLEQSVAELRRLAHGVRPARLDDGLRAALSSLGADCPIPVEFDVADTDASDVVLTTAYFVVAEAMANALKHARATRIRISARRTHERLTVLVADDGIGGAPTGSGLTTLRDRIDSIGGTLAVTSVLSSGTTIEAVLPCA